MPVTIEVDPKTVGYAFAYADGKAQAVMINEMALELKGSYSSDFGYTLSKYLDRNGIEFIESIKKFIDLRNKNG